MNEFRNKSDELAQKRLEDQKEAAQKMTEAEKDTLLIFEQISAYADQEGHAENLPTMRGNVIMIKGDPALQIKCISPTEFSLNYDGNGIGIVVKNINLQGICSREKMIETVVKHYESL